MTPAATTIDATTPEARPEAPPHPATGRGTGRVAEHPIHPLFLERWSPRSFDGEPVAAAQVAALFEAARWAPSSGNLQPWRFLYALRDDPHWPLFLDALNEKNQAWAGAAAVLVAVASRPIAPARDGRPARDNRSHAFDAGAAWGFLALQAAHDGLATHAIGGFDDARARANLNLPDEIALHCFIAIGRHAPGDVPRPGERARQSSFVQAGPLPRAGSASQPS